MGNYTLSCCSTADLTKEYFDNKGIRYVCFHFELDDKEYFDNLGESVSADELYSAMARGADTKTSQVSVGEYIDYFTEILEGGNDIFHVTLSSGISGTYNSACIASDELKEKYPERKIYIVDSLGASSGYGLIMDKLTELKESGMEIDELHNWIEENKLNMHHWFFSTDLKYYIRGGRITKTAGFVGTALNICPLLNMDNAGHLIPQEKIRTKKRVIKKIVEKMEKNAEDGNEYSGKCYISQSDCYDDARALADLVEEKFPRLEGKVEIFNIGAVIGGHTGPGTVALYFWGKERTK
jgi:DegV family protein with EDD domain